MKTIHKVALGVLIALALVAPLFVFAAANRPAPQPTVIRIAADPTNTPPGAPCHGMGC
jgi:hypothetical protein